MNSTFPFGTIFIQLLDFPISFLFFIYERAPRVSRRSSRRRTGRGRSRCTPCRRGSRRSSRCTAGGCRRTCRRARTASAARRARRGRRPRRAGHHAVELPALVEEAHLVGVAHEAAPTNSCGSASRSRRMSARARRGRRRPWTVPLVDGDAGAPQDGAHVAAVLERAPHGAEEVK